MAENKSKKLMRDPVSDFLVLKIFNIQTRKGRVISFMKVIWQISSVNIRKKAIKERIKERKIDTENLMWFGVQCVCLRPRLH